MADFDAAYRKIMGYEGGYVDDPDDAGGETYRGISRRYHPSWRGWEYIDRLKEEKNRGNGAIELLIEHYAREFYRSQFWDPMLLGEVLDQSIANEMFDCGVNLGITRAVMFLQTALNVMNQGGKLYHDLVVDGKMGPKTLSALHALPPRDLPVLLRWLDVQLGAH